MAGDGHEHAPLALLQRPQLRLRSAFLHSRSEQAVRWEFAGHLPVGLVYECELVEIARDRMFCLSIECERHSAVAEAYCTEAGQADSLREITTVGPAVHGPVDVDEPAAAVEKGVDFRRPLRVPVAMLVEDHDIGFLKLLLRRPLPRGRNLHLVHR